MHLPRHIAWYLICFMVGSALGLVPILIVEVLENTNDSVAATIVAIVREMQAVVVVCGGLSYGTVESVTMIAEIFLKNREEKGRAEGRVEGRKEGRAEGIVEGHEKGRVEGIEEGRVRERRQIGSRFEGMTEEEQVAEVARLIQEARRNDRRE